MATEVIQNLDRQITYVTWNGPIALKLLLETVGNVTSLTRTPLSLWDFSGATGIDFNLADLQRLLSATRQAREQNPGARTAIVTPNKLLFGIGRQAQSFITLEDLAQGIEIFHDRSAALAWLGIVDGAA